jgi:hypothetical protein
MYERCMQIRISDLQLNLRLLSSSMEEFLWVYDVDGAEFLRIDIVLVSHCTFYM